MNEAIINKIIENGNVDQICLEYDLEPNEVMDWLFDKKIDKLSFFKLIFFQNKVIQKQEREIIELKCIIQKSLHNY